MGTEWRRITISARFHMVRTGKGLTQQQLADMARVSRNTIVKLESSYDMKMSTVMAVSDALGAPFHVWFLPDMLYLEWYGIVNTHSTGG